MWESGPKESADSATRQSSHAGRGARSDISVARLVRTSFISFFFFVLLSRCFSRKACVRTTPYLCLSECKCTYRYTCIYLGCLFHLLLSSSLLLSFFVRFGSSFFFCHPHFLISTSRSLGGSFLPFKSPSLRLSRSCSGPALN